MGHPAREEVWRLHAERVPVREIATRLNLPKSTVQRIISAGRDTVREAIVERARDAGVVDMATWLLEQAKRDHDDSLRVSEMAEQAVYVDKKGETHIVVDHKALVGERKTRSTVRSELARLLGVDPIRREALELRRRQLAGNDSLRETLEKALGLDDDDQEDSVGTQEAS